MRWTRSSAGADKMWSGWSRNFLCMKDRERKAMTGYNWSEIDKINLGSYKVTGFVFGILSLRVLLLEI